MNEEQTKRFLTNLFTDNSAVNSPLCHANQDEIAAYVEAELNGLHTATRYPELSAQIASCESCRTLYEELKELFTLEWHGTFVEPPVAATFDLSFLPERDGATHRVGIPAFAAVTSVARARGPESILWTLNELGQLIVALSAEFLATLQPSPQPTYLKASARDLFDVTSPALADDLMVTLTATTMRRNPEQCSVTVTAEIPSRGGWPNLAGTTVTLAVGDETVVTRTTDVFGKVVFDGIAHAELSQLRIAVEPASSH